MKPTGLDWARVSLLISCGACASLPAVPALDERDYAIARVMKPCLEEIHAADEASRGALIDECQERVDALEECR